jgi:hypothetical protein
MWLIVAIFFEKKVQISLESKLEKKTCMKNSSGFNFDVCNYFYFTSSDTTLFNKKSWLCRRVQNYFNFYKSWNKCLIKINEAASLQSVHFCPPTLEIPLIIMTVLCFCVDRISRKRRAVQVPPLLNGKESWGFNITSTEKLISLRACLRSILSTYFGVWPKSHQIAVSHCVTGNRSSFHLLKIDSNVTSHIQWTKTPSDWNCAEKE